MTSASGRKRERKKEMVVAGRLEGQVGTDLACAVPHSNVASTGVLTVILSANASALAARCSMNRVGKNFFVRMRVTVVQKSSVPKWMEVVGSKPRVM